MNYLVGILIFIIVLFTYIHITHQYKRSEDLEIYEMDYVNNNQLQEICDVKQPIIFDFGQVLPAFFQNSDLENICNKHGEEILNIKDTNDYYKAEKESSVHSVHINCANVRKLFQNDASSHYYTENNGEFLEETGLSEKVKMVDKYLKPIFTVNTKYDYISGSAKTCTPLRYHFDYRQYYIVTSGKITVKMTPWKSCKYLHPIKDYDAYEFRSAYNAWMQSSIEMEKVRFLEYSVEKGSVIYIPPYWWYSIQFADNTSIYAITYNSLMNVVAYSPQWFLYFIQQQNIYKKVAKTVYCSDKESNVTPPIQESENQVSESSENTTTIQSL